jgi:hypothetical protein
VTEIDSLVSADTEARSALDRAVDVLGEIRRQKSIEKRPLKAQIDVAIVRWDGSSIAAVRRIEADLRPAAGVGRFEYEEHSGNLELGLTFAEGEPGA